MVAYTLDDGEDAGVADGEALTCAASGEEAAAGAAVKGDIAEYDVELAFAGGAALAAEDDFAAGEAFADEVVGEAFEHEREAGGGECAEALAGDAGQIEAEGGVGGVAFVLTAGLAEGELAGEPRAEGAVFIGDFAAPGEGLAGGVGGERGPRSRRRRWAPHRGARGGRCERPASIFRLLPVRAAWG